MPVHGTGAVLIVVAVAVAVCLFSAWTVRGSGRRWSTVGMFAAVAAPTFVAVYVGVGLVRHAFGV